MLSKKDIELVKSTVPLLEQGGTAITEHFYTRMFANNPELKHIFNMSNQHTNKQRIALFEAILAYAKNIENISVLQAAVERIAQKHTSFNIQPQHYDIVGLHLIETMRELLGNQFSADIEQAWKTAYSVLANVFIQREEEIYTTSETKIGGWRGKRAFKLIEKKSESELVTSFTFVPVDGMPVIDFKPGQYLGIEIEGKQLEFTEIRQYSLSDKPNGQSYRISVKRELGEHKGLVSNYLHDHLNQDDIVDLYAPAGDFFLQEAIKPTVLISAGVGLTPMQAMLEYKASINYPEQVYYLHACENKAQHSFLERTQFIVEDNKWQAHTWYNQGKTDKENTYNGLMNLSNIALPFQNAQFYICGPVGFMAFIKEQLLKLNVTENAIHYEVFGPHATL